VSAAAPRFLEVKIFGTERVNRQLFRGALAVGNMQPALEEVADDMMYAIQQNFNSQGRRGGGSWKFLDKNTINEKARKGQEPFILIATGALYDSMTQRGDSNQRLEVTDHYVSLSSELSYADIHVTGGEHMPKRDYTQLLTSDRLRWVAICEGYLERAMSVE
jgi:phage gpG-like protein